MMHNIVREDGHVVMPSRGKGDLSFPVDLLDQLSKMGPLETSKIIAEAVRFHTITKGTEYRWVTPEELLGTDLEEYGVYYADSSPSQPHLTYLGPVCSIQQDETNPHLNLYAACDKDGEPIDDVRFIKHSKLLIHALNEEDYTEKKELIELGNAEKAAAREEERQLAEKAAELDSRVSAFLKKANIKA